MNYKKFQSVLTIVPIFLFLYSCGSEPKIKSGVSNNDATSNPQKKEGLGQAVDNKQAEVGQNLVKEKITEHVKADKSNENLKSLSDRLGIESTSEKPEISVPSFKYNVTADLNPNRFNRLLEIKHTGRSDLHDPTIPSLKYLQKPSEAFQNLPKASSGNKVDWVKAVELGKIDPRHDINDPGIKPMIMDLNIVMQVKGSMPDVVFPHREHTRWLDCSNCHPAIFIPQSGSNKMSMADNLLGQKCGVCHGKVAFPLSSCIKCHSNKKIIVQEKK